MLCRRSRAWISLALDGVLPPDRTVALTAHLERCAGCRAHREDLLLGRRLLAATTPRPSENLEWRIQLKLNQALQEAARAASSPLAEPAPGLGRWWRLAGAAAVAGLALTLAAANWLLPPLPTAPERPALVAAGPEPAGAPVEVRGPVLPEAPEVAARSPGRDSAGSVGSTAGDADRTSYIGAGPSLLWRGQPRDGMLGRPASETTRIGWSGSSLDDLRTITALREANQRLRAQLSISQRQIESLRAQLDSVSVRPAPVAAPR